MLLVLQQRAQEAAGQAGRTCAFEGSAAPSLLPFIRCHVWQVWTLELPCQIFLSPVLTMTLLVGCHHSSPPARAGHELHRCHQVSHARCITTSAWLPSS